MMAQTILFHQILQPVDTEAKCHEILSFSNLHYCLKPYKIKPMVVQEALKIFELIQKRYETEQFIEDPRNWHKNERKIFIWFLICYCFHKNTFPNQLETIEWEEIQQIFYKKDPLLLKYQGLSILKNQGKKLWSLEDDEILVKLVKQMGEGNWNQVSKAIYFDERKQKFITPKQCRERWYNHKSQTIFKGQWDPREDTILLQYCLTQNKKWTKISKLLQSRRTQHMVKNRYHCLIKKYGTGIGSEDAKLKNALKKTQQKLKELQQHSKQEQQSSVLLSKQEDIKIPNHKIQISFKQLPAKQKKLQLISNMEFSVPFFVDQQALINGSFIDKNRYQKASRKNGFSIYNSASFQTNNSLRDGTSSNIEDLQGFIKLPLKKKVIEIQNYQNPS